jgi:phosphocarrier protein
MGVIAMGAGYNTQLTITVEGPDESEAVAVLENLFESKFEEE